MWTHLAWLTAAGALGTAARYVLSTWIQQHWPEGWPVGILAVNTLGCLLAGLVFAGLEQYWPAHAGLRLILLTGFMGAFTTFSALMLEVGQILRTAGWPWALGHMALQIGLGFLALAVGWWLMHRMA